MASGRVILTKNEAFAYKLPPGQNTGKDTNWKANSWNLSKPDWTGKLKLVTGSDKSCYIKLESAGSIYAECQVDNYPGPAVTTVSDSSRYFVIQMKNKEYLGLGFADRSDSFDLNVALQSHFKGILVEEAIEKESNEPPKEKLDLSLKEGQTIKVNINIPKKSTRNRSKSPSVTGRGLPPPNAAAMEAAGLVAPKKFPAPPTKQTNPNWIQF
ncbi:NECAP1_2 [Lepeophtheirus salmonis]|uniref:NECAP1_2 n=1 Tax=Lepeophtheirus salmonis TaxID=72036 RepID=A0A0K2UJ84_LEPSM|nr:NECAP-like protein CG9132 [Lepeophtheirus salmonis]CAB4064960.1 NECAP1_2 [Lepeophtheirus salmonis]CAF2949967.1 NECAP1_2 [Lepeophtheirus salmonis]